jgi:hypothetical protein
LASLIDGPETQADIGAAEPKAIAQSDAIDTFLLRGVRDVVEGEAVAGLVEVDRGWESGLVVSGCLSDGSIVFFGDGMGVRI